MLSNRPNDLYRIAKNIRLQHLLSYGALHFLNLDSEFSCVLHMFEMIHFVIMIFPIVPVDLLPTRTF